VLSLKNIKLTVKVLLTLSLVFIVTLFMSDALFFWLAVNTFLTWPLLLRKKGRLIENSLSSLNSKLDSMIESKEFLMRIERNRAG